MSRAEFLRMDIAHRRAHIRRMHAIEGLTPYVKALLSHQRIQLAKLTVSEGV